VLKGVHDVLLEPGDLDHHRLVVWLVEILFHCRDDAHAIIFDCIVELSELDLAELRVACFAREVGSCQLLIDGGDRVDRRGAEGHEKRVRRHGEFSRV